MNKGYTKSTVDKIKQMLKRHSMAYISRLTDIPASSIANIRDGKYFIKEGGKKCNKVSKDYFNWGDFKNIV